MTPQQIAGLKKDIEDDVELLDGYEDMGEDMQAKIRQALMDGHVADEDWKGVCTLFYSVGSAAELV